ncbi:MAG: (2Fe-2S)-binding protein [Gammaproteobacteria bacterium]
MIVCCCTAVTERQIRQAVAEGVTCLDELRARLGVDSECGCCAEEAENILQRCLMQGVPAREPSTTQAVALSFQSF